MSGEGGIRTHGALLAPTRSPGAPIRPLSHLSSSRATKKAEREGFEPPVPVGTVDFESTAFNRSAISPWLTMLLTQVPKERAEQGAAFRLADAADDRKRVVEPPAAQDVELRAASSGFRVAATKHKPLNAG